MTRKTDAEIAIELAESPVITIKAVDNSGWLLSGGPYGEIRLVCPEEQDVMRHVLVALQEKPEPESSDEETS